MAGDWFLSCPYCGSTYYGTAGHICPAKYYQPPYITYPQTNSDFGYIYITQDEYKRLLEDSRQLQEIRKMLGWHI